MLNLDPAKLLVIAVVAIILLGPDKLPQVARQVGGAWRSFNEFRHRMETEVRNTMPDLPSTTEIARLARSPSALLDHLSNMGPDEAGDDGAEADSDANASDSADVDVDLVAGDEVPSQNGTSNGAVDAASAVPLNDVSPADDGPTSSSTPAPTAAAEHPPDAAASPDVTSTPPGPAPSPRSPDVIVPADPGLN
jgi:sec-independent protein translocase protein TatB